MHRASCPFGRQREVSDTIPFSGVIVTTSPGNIKKNLSLNHLRKDLKDRIASKYSGVSSVSSHFFGFYSCIDNWIFGMNTVFKRLLMDKKFFVIVVVCYVFY